MQSIFFSQGLGSIVQMQFRLAPAVTYDLDVGPVEVADARSQGFGYGFLDRKATSQARWPTLAVGDLLRREKTAEETVTMPGRSSLDPGYLNQVNAAD